MMRGLVPHMAYTFKELIIDTLKQAKKPLSPKEIWDLAVALKISDCLASRGKTPWHTIGAKIYMDMKTNVDSPFIQVGTAPTRFYLKALWNGISIEEAEEESIETVDQRISPSRIGNSFHERDLHPLLVKALYSHPHFKCNVKTILHESSKKSRKGYNEWLHPDLVGVYFPFEDYDKSTLMLQESLKENPYKLFAFEMKINMTMLNLREYFFQAVSNSSWAHEGYLVALHIDEDTTFRDELRRLANAFGIGIIEMDARNIEESQILFPAREKAFLDWDTMNRLISQNNDFRKFISDLTEDIKLGKVKSKYDKVLEDESYLDYIIEKKIVLQI